MSIKLPPPLQAWTPSLSVHQICSPLFSDSSLKTENTTTFIYSGRNDFGRIIKKLLFCSPSQGFSNSYFQDMKDLGKLEGFEIIASSSIYSVRDPKLTTTDGIFLEPTCSSSLQRALQRCYQRNLYLKNHAAVVSEVASFKGGTIGNVALSQLHRRSKDGINENQHRDSRLYFEGGNGLHVTNASQKPMFLIGEDLLTATHQVLRLDKWFAQRNENKKTVSDINEELLFSKYKTLINQWYLNGEIPQKIQTIALEIATRLTDDEVKNILMEMNQMGLLINFKFDAKEDKHKGREIASQYLAQREFVKSQIFPTELNCSSTHIAFITQIAYHLDLFLAPGPKGSILMQDFEFCIRLLETIQKNADDLKLSKDDLKQLQIMLKMMEQLQKDFKTTMQKARDELTQSGFVVIPAPGAFFGLTDLGTPLNINFLNGISGYSPKNRHYFYATAGAKTTGKLGQILMESFVEFLNHQCDNLAVYYLGRSTNDPKDFTEATDNLSRLKGQLGPHCLSFELEIEQHKT